MGTPAVFSLAFGVFLAGTAVHDQSIAHEMRKLDGSWVILHAEHDGKPIPLADVDGTTIVIAENRAWGRTKGKPDGAVGFSVETAAAPRRVEVHMGFGPCLCLQAPGIYEWAGDRLRICVGINRRPKAFRTAPKSESVFLVLKRQQP